MVMVSPNWPLPRVVALFLQIQGSLMLISGTVAKKLIAKSWVNAA
jgi:hypothetical protein